MPDIQCFINEFNGRPEKIGDTDANRGECVGLVEVWLDRIGAPHIWGNACDLPANADRGAYAIIPNTPDFVPAPGDIGVLPAGWGGSSVGHTFLVAPGTNVLTLVAFEQNDRIDGGDGRCRLFDHLGWPDGLVFIHPHALDVLVPAVALPAPEPDAPAPTPVQPEPAAPVDMPVESVPVAADPAPAPAEAPAQPVPVVQPDTNIVDPSLTSEQANPIQPSIVAPEKEMQTLSKFLSRKFLLTCLGVAVTIGGYALGALNAGESLTSVVFLVGLFNVVQGLIDHKSVSVQ